jgi:hypothetical protein
MAELPEIQSYILESHPDARTDAYRWRVWFEDGDPLWVELSGPEANETELGLPELHERLPDALQRYAALEQTAAWDGPVELAADHFRGTR